MWRILSLDHVLFDECIRFFRLPEGLQLNARKEKSRSYILTAFEIAQSWELGVCTVHPTYNAYLQGAYSAYISKVDNPDWVPTMNSNLFGIALSSIISFVTKSPCKSTRDDYLCKYESLLPCNYKEIALQHPIRAAGVGLEKLTFSEARLADYVNKVVSLIEALQTMKYEDYVFAMQSIRLTNLSLINKRDDFGLAYSLIVAAIESVAQKSIKREVFKKKPENEKIWKQRAETDTEFAELLAEYHNVRKEQQHLGKRFVKFILDSTPVEEWEDLVPDLYQEALDALQAANPNLNVPKSITEPSLMPSQLPQETINKLLIEAYKHRSVFVHKGEQPPHKDPSGTSSNRYFEITNVNSKTGGGTEEVILPTYELLSGIATNSITKWINSKVQT